MPFLYGKKCNICGKKRSKSDSFVCLGGGALKGNKQVAEMSNELIGFLTLSLHDHENMGKGYLKIADNAKNGQFEFYFCSCDCLRKFLAEIVDKFEKNMK